jgi:hypothetical protein
MEKQFASADGRAAMITDVAIQVAAVYINISTLDCPPAAELFTKPFLIEPQIICNIVLDSLHVIDSQDAAIVAPFTIHVE